jgi:P27 family predicted phage terminase small subunit
LRTLRFFNQLVANFDVIGEWRDLFQDVFAVLLNGGLESFRGSSEHEFRSYLKTITENEARNCLRRLGRKLEFFEQPVSAEDESGPETSFAASLADPSLGPEDLAISQDIRTKLNGCIQQIAIVDQESESSGRQFERPDGLMPELIRDLVSCRLAASCDAYGRWAGLSVEIQHFGLILESPSGYPTQSPHLAILNTALEQMKVFSTEFGMTASSRSRVKTANPKQRSLFGDFPR